MSITTVHPSSFISVIDMLGSDDTVYVIPSFQRPYAWESKQVDDLRADIEKAHGAAGYHYLSSFHLVPINNIATDPLCEFIEDAKDILSESCDNADLETKRMTPVKFYAVIDGQQRLTTLFFLAHIFYKLKGGSRQNLEVMLSCGSNIPRLIQNPKDDHQFMMSIVDFIWNPNNSIAHPKTQSQKHMEANFRNLYNWCNSKPISNSAANFLNSQNFKTIAIELEPSYGLTSFMILNDRGKDLTVLEKFKALLIEFAYDALRFSSSGPSIVNQLHRVFGNLYKTLDVCIYVGLFPSKPGAADSAIIRLLSCYIRIDQAADKASIWQGAEESYQEFFRKQLADTPIKNVSSIINEWCDKVDEISCQLNQLCQYLDQNMSSIPSIHFPSQSQTVCDDYRATILSLGLQPHLLALMLNFRALFNKEWHERFPIKSTPFSLKNIHGLLDKVQQKADILHAPQVLYDYLSDLICKEIPEKNEISMLEIVERMQILDWNLGSRKYQGFIDRWHAAKTVTSAQDYIQHWFNWRDAQDFISDILYRYNESNTRYLLKEYERSYGVNLHFSTPPNIAKTSLELEHIFAQNIAQNPSFPGFAAFGLVDRAEFENIVLWRTGNFTWLSKEANASLGNSMPDIKAAAHYTKCHGHPSSSSCNICSDINITKKVGDKLVTIGSHYPSMRLYISARCAELALFAVSRFS